MTGESGPNIPQTEVLPSTEAIKQPSAALQLRIAQGKLDPLEHMNNIVPAEVSRVSLDALHNQNIAKRRADEALFIKKSEQEGGHSSEQLREAHMTVWSRGAFAEIASLIDSKQKVASDIFSKKLHITMDDVSGEALTQLRSDQFYNPTTKTEGAFYKEFCTGNMNAKLANALTIEEMHHLKQFLTRWMLGSDTAFDALVTLKYAMDQVKNQKGQAEPRANEPLNDRDRKILNYFKTGSEMNQTTQSIQSAVATPQPTEVIHPEPQPTHIESTSQVNLTPQQETESKHDDQLSSDIEVLIAKLQPGQAGEIRRLGKEIIFTPNELQQLDTLTSETSRKLKENQQLQSLLDMIQHYTSINKGFEIGAGFGSAYIANPDIDAPKIVSEGTSGLLKIELPPKLLELLKANDSVNSVIDLLDQYHDTLGKGGTNNVGGSFAGTLKKVLQGYRQLFLSSESPRPVSLEESMETMPSPNDIDKQQSELPSAPTKEEINALAQQAFDYMHEKRNNPPTTGTILEQMGDSGNRALITAVSKIPDDIGEHFAAHGIARGESNTEQLQALINLLQGEQLQGDSTIVTMNPHAPLPVYRTGGFIVIGPKDQELRRDDGTLAIQTVAVNEQFYTAIPSLQKWFPEVNFVRAEDLPTRLQQEASK